jgi:predicted DNA-binding transcriptional regulator AlpA
MARGGTAKGGGIVGSFPQLCPRLLSREQAAAYCGHGPTKFCAMVDDGRMPKPIHVDSRVLWDRFDLDQSIDELKAKDDVDDATEARQAWEDRLKD